jgi:hypothetical protein
MRAIHSVLRGLLRRVAASRVLITRDEGHCDGAVLWAPPSDRRSSTCLRFASVRRSPLYPLVSSPPALPSTAHLLPLRSPSPVYRLRSSTRRLLPLPHVFTTQRTRSIRSLYPLATTTPLSLFPFPSGLSYPPSPIPVSSSPLPPAPSSATAHLLSSLPLHHSPYLVPLANLPLPRNSTTTGSRVSSRSLHPGPRPRARSGRNMCATWRRI